VIGLLASLITVPLTFSYLGPERYGLWMVLISIISVMGFADLGIGNGLINAISEAYGKDDEPLAREYLTSALVMMLCIATVLAIAGAAAYPFLPWTRMFNVKSGAVAAEGARALLVLYSWFVISIPLGVVTRAQGGLQKGYLPQIIGAIGSIGTLLALLGVIALHGSVAGLCLHLRGHCFHPGKWMGSVSRTSLARARPSRVPAQFGGKDTPAGPHVLRATMRRCS
jgi:O-antigen/teichoic acid export membrane protein